MTIIRGFEDLKSKLENKDSAEKKTPKPEYWTGIKKNAPLPSPLLSWWTTQSLLRSQGKLNELDIADMKQAMRGVKNKWTKICKDDPKAIDDLLSYSEGKYVDRELADILWIEIREKKKADQNV
jgi:hypothetical protein